MTALWQPSLAAKLMQPFATTKNRHVHKTTIESISLSRFLFNVVLATLRVLLTVDVCCHTTKQVLAADVLSGAALQFVQAASERTIKPSSDQDAANACSAVEVHRCQLEATFNTRQAARAVYSKDLAWTCSEKARRIAWRGPTTVSLHLQPGAREVLDACSLLAQVVVDKHPDDYEESEQHANVDGHPLLIVGILQSVSRQATASASAHVSEVIQLPIRIVPIIALRHRAKRLRCSNRERQSAAQTEAPYTRVM